jgi:hypothetical protein
MLSTATSASIAATAASRVKLQTPTEKCFIYRRRASCLVDQKAATRWVKYNIMLKNSPAAFTTLSPRAAPGAQRTQQCSPRPPTTRFLPLSGGSGRSGVYKDEKTGKYVAALSNGTPLSDGAWGSQGYSTISSCTKPTRPRHSSITCGRSSPTNHPSRRNWRNTCLKRT